MILRSQLVLLGAIAATVSMVDAAVANADDYIDFGVNQAAFKSAAKRQRRRARANDSLYFAD